MVMDELNKGHPVIQSPSAKNTNQKNQLTDGQEFPESHDYCGQTGPQLISEAYNVNKHWCQVCELSYELACKEHSISEIPDKPAPPRAKYSLPASLQMYELQPTGEGEYSLC